MSTKTFSGSTGVISTTIVTHTCCTCGVVFGFSSEYDSRRRQDRKTFYCPNGHAQAFAGPTEAEKLRAELARKTAAMDQVEQSRRLAWQKVDEAERSASAAKGQVTKLRNRAAAGVCPCCNRTFKQLAAHMKGMHPEFPGK